MERIYFDNQSTTLLSTDVIDLMTETMREGYANPASQHEYGRIARRKLESCRDQIKHQLGLGRTDRCIFTSGGTESNNLAILGHFSRTGHSGKVDRPVNVVTTAIEHPSVLAVLEYLRTQEHPSVEIRSVDANSNGSVSPADFESKIDSETCLAICMLANNETGAIQPVEQIASICKAHQVPLHVDAVQAIGKYPFDFASLGCSSATVSPHKIHGPPGMGVLLANDKCRINPLLFGGFQQEGIRPGTESLVLAVGTSRAIELAISNQSDNILALSVLRDRFETTLKAKFPFITINCKDGLRLPNASNISFRGFDRQQFVLACDMAGLACSTGSACSSGSSQTSHVLASMGCEKELIDSAVRFGFSTQNQLEEVDLAIERIERILVSKKP